MYTTTQSREMQAEFLRGDIGAGVTSEARLLWQPGAEDIAPTYTPLISILVTCIPASVEVGCLLSRVVCDERIARAFPQEVSGHPFACESAALALCRPPK